MLQPGVEVRKEQIADPAGQALSLRRCVSGTNSFVVAQHADEYRRVLTACCRAGNAQESPVSEGEVICAFTSQPCTRHGIEGRVEGEPVITSIEI